MINQEQPQEYRVFYTKGDEIVDNGTRDSTLEQLQADFPDPNYAIIPVGEVPDNWRNMTIVDGALVPATEEVIATREVAQGVDNTEAKRQKKEVRYKTDTDSLMYDAMEDLAKIPPDYTKLAAWVTAKNAIRNEVE